MTSWQFSDMNAHKGTQDMMSDLVANLIDSQGIRGRYINRNSVTDDVLSSPTSSKFDKGASIAIYLDRGVLSDSMHSISSLGFHIDDSIKIYLSTKHWGGIKSEMGSDNPEEGDLIWIPAPIERLFEIKFVENEEKFFNFGKNVSYRLDCELFKYGGEEFDFSGDSDASDDAVLQALDAWDNSLNTGTLDEEIKTFDVGDKAKKKTEHKVSNTKKTTTIKKDWKPSRGL